MTYLQTFLNPSARSAELRAVLWGSDDIDAVELD